MPQRQSKLNPKGFFLKDGKKRNEPLMLYDNLKVALDMNSVSSIMSDKTKP